MAQTERNFTLKKGETTIDIRLRELAESHDSRLTDELRKISETLVGLGEKGHERFPNDSIGGKYRRKIARK
jgi:hypothetical protein